MNKQRIMINNQNPNDVISVFFPVFLILIRNGVLPLFVQN